MSTELRAMEEWLTAAIGGIAGIDIPGGVHGEVAPPGTSAPYVVFAHLAGTDKTAGGGYRIWTEARYLVKAVDASESFSRVDGIAGAIDAAIHSAGNVTVPSGLILSCMREEPYSFVEKVNNVEYRHRGGIYRIRVN